MSEDDYKGLPNILGVTPPRKTTRVVTPKTPEDPLMEYVDKVIYMKPLELPKNVLKKDEYGYTPAQNKQINDYLTRPGDRKFNGSFQNLVKGNINDKPKVREENALERINRINYEFKVTKERPGHLDNKNIVSWEDKQKAVRKNEVKSNQPRRKL